MEATQRLAGLLVGISGVCRSTGLVSENFDDGIHATVYGGDAVEVGVNDFARRGLPRGDECRQFTRRLAPELFCHDFPLVSSRG